MITSTQQIGFEAQLQQNPEQHVFIVQWMRDRVERMRHKEKAPDNAQSQTSYYAQRAQDVELRAGFRALRKKELAAVCDDHGLKLDVSGSRDDVLMQVESFWQRSEFQNEPQDDGEITIQELRRFAHRVHNLPWDEVKGMKKDDLLQLLQPA